MKSASTFCVASTSTPCSSLNASPAPSMSCARLLLTRRGPTAAPTCDRSVEPEALVGLEPAGRGDEPALPRIAQIRQLRRSRSSRPASSSFLGLRERRGEPGPGRGLAVHRVGIQVELRDAARPRIAEPGVDRAIELAARSSCPIGVISVTSDIAATRRLRSRRPRSIGRPPVRGCPERRPSVVTTSTSRVATRLDELVPFQIERAGVVGLELEPAPLEPDDLAGDAIAVGERDDVGPPLGVARLPRKASEPERDCSERARRPRHGASRHAGTGIDDGAAIEC